MKKSLQKFAEKLISRLSPQKYYPKDIFLEVTNYCNLRCKYCHLQGEGAVMTRPKGYMNPKIWKKIIDEIGGWNKPVNLITHGGGEPLLYDKLEELIKYAKRYKNISVGFLTNGTLLSLEWAKKIIDYEVDWIGFSIDGTRSQTYNFYRKNANLELVEKNIYGLIEEKKWRGGEKPAIRFNMVGHPEIIDQKEEFVRKWLPHANIISIAKYREMNSKKLFSHSSSVNFKPCALLFKSIMILHDGKAVLCCEDYNADVKIGQVFTKSILDIYNSSIINLYREKHKRGKIDSLELCKDCHIWMADITSEDKITVLSDIKSRYLKTMSMEIYERLI
jgi:MoaA/NifB/PqqE/SkfB family radical SAM enzyme